MSGRDPGFRKLTMQRSFEAVKALGFDVYTYSLWYLPEWYYVLCIAYSIKWT